MSFDLAIDYTTGDLMLAPGKDVQGRTGADVYEQRIRVRLKIQRETWIFDPTDGELGSRLLELARVPAPRALIEIEQYVREALEPMDDITVQQIDARFSDDSQSVIVLDISYLPSTDQGAASEVAEQSVTVTIPIS